MFMASPKSSQVQVKNASPSQVHQVQEYSQHNEPTKFNILSTRHWEQWSSDYNNLK